MLARANNEGETIAVFLGRDIRDFAPDSSPRYDAEVAVDSRVACGLLLMAACTPKLLLPSVPSLQTAKTEVLVVGEDGVAQAHYVLDLTQDEPLLFDLPQARFRAEAFIFSLSPADLGIATGKNSLTGGETPTNQVYRAFEAASPELHWAETNTPRWLDQVRLPELGYAQCVESGGCKVDNKCQVPCDVEVTVTPPETPAVPRMDCPIGWTATVAYSWPSGDEWNPATVSGCLPWVVPPSCDAGSYFVVGLGCQRIGRVCPLDDNPPDTIGGRRSLFVSPGARGGDGSRQMPFGIVVEALGAAGRGDRIVLGRGVHQLGAPLTVAQDVELTGLCPELTTIEGQIAFEGDGVRLTDATVSGSLALVSGQHTLANLSVSSNQESAISVSKDATLLASDILVVSDGPGIKIDSTGPSELERFQIVSRLAGLEVGEDAVVVAKDGVFRSRSEASSGAVFVNGGRVDLQRVAVDRGRGIRAVGGVLNLVDVAIVNTAYPTALSVENSDLDAIRLYISNPNGRAIETDGGATTLVDTVLERSGLPWALDTEDSALTLRRVAILKSRQGGVVAAGGSVTVEDLVMQSIGERFGGCGLCLRRANAVAISRAWLSELFGSGLELLESQGSMRDVTVLNSGRGTCGWGIRLIDCDFSDATSSRRWRIVDPRGDGLFLRSEVEVEDLTILRPIENIDCAQTASTSGDAINLVAGSLKATNFVVANAAQAGLRSVWRSFEEPPTATLVSGRLTGNQIGFWLEAPSAKVGQLMDRVVFTDNGQNVRSPAE